MAEKKEHFEIVGDTIRFDAKNITKAEAKAVKKLADLFNYKLVPYIPEIKKEPKEIWTAAAVQKFLEENGTKAQQKQYWDKFNAPMLDDAGKPVVYKNDSKDGRHKKGETRVKGHVATMQWFKKEFPNYGK